MQLMEKYPVAVLGAGPIGLSVAANLLEQGLRPLIFEASDAVGASFRDFSHVRLFSPWQYNVDKAARKLLEASGWTMPDEEAIPTAGELLQLYLEPLAALPTIDSRLRLQSRVVAIARQGVDKVKTAGREQAPFIIRVERQGEIEDVLAGAVIDATGNWAQPNPIGANGLPALGEEQLAHRINYGMPDIKGKLRPRYLGKTTLVVGAGHSAAGSLIALADLAEADVNTNIHWALRSSSPTRVFGGGEADQLPARGALGIRLKALVEQGRLTLHTQCRIRELQENPGGITVIPEEGEIIVGVDEIVCATGSRPNLEMLRELRIRTDAWLESSDALAPLIDPNVHSCGTVRPHGHRELAHPEPGFYIVGAKSYGRAPTFLLATGHEQARSVAAALAGDIAAADDVRLELPETGVCSTDFGDGGGCCGESSENAETVADTQSESSCGCGESSENAETVVETRSESSCGCSPEPRPRSSCCG